MITLTVNGTLRSIDADGDTPLLWALRDHQLLIVPETDDQLNSLGTKGIGEIGTVGMNAAVANAVFDATG
jgi:xanthine dehydrogenase YagR molybdenum-binding subunit